MPKGPRGERRNHFKRHQENFPARIDPTRTHKNRIGVGGGERGNWKHGSPRHKLVELLQKITPKPEDQSDN